MKYSVIGYWFFCILSSLVLGTILLYIIDYHTCYIFALGVVPVFVPNYLDIGIVENDNKRLILPFKAAKLINFDSDINKRWYVEFWAWSKSENRLKRKRITSFNHYNNSELREKYALNLIREINKLLESGYHFDNLKLQREKGIEEIKKIKEHINIIDYLLKSLELNKNKYNGSTYSDKKHDINVYSKFIKFYKFSNLSIDDIDKIHCIKYQNWLIQKGYSGKTINSRVSTIQTFFYQAIDNDIISNNPFKGIKRLKEVRTSINRAFNNIEIEKIKGVLKVNYPDIWCVCMLMFYCFLRPNEIRQLKIQNIDLINKKVYVGSLVSKNKKSSFVDIPEPLIKLLIEYLGAETDKNKYLFSRFNKPDCKLIGRNTLRDRYEYIIKDLKLDSDLTFYSWKHTGVVKAYKSGIDIKSLQIQGRWHSIDQMDNYLKSIGLIENTAFTNIMNKIEV